MCQLLVDGKCMYLLLNTARLQSVNLLLFSVIRGVNANLPVYSDSRQTLRHDWMICKLKESRLVQFYIVYIYLIDIFCIVRACIGNKRVCICKIFVPKINCKVLFTHAIAWNGDSTTCSLIDKIATQLSSQFFYIACAVIGSINNFNRSTS